MKKILLSVLSIVAISAASMAQGLTIYVDGTTTDISGSSTSVTVTEATSIGLANNHMEDFLVLNESGSDQIWIITREIVSAPGSWTDYFCFGVNPGSGTCYPPNASTFYASDTLTIPAGGEGLITVYANCDVAGSATYRYHVSTMADPTNYIDFVDLNVNSTLSLTEVPNLTVEISPNPASSKLNINTEGVNNATATIVDVLGNVVFKEEVYGSKTVDVAKFKNGIYFVNIEADGVKTVTRKVIVRH